MSGTERSVRDVNDKVLAGQASVLTETELWETLQAGVNPDALDLDVVIAAFSSSIRGSSAMLLVPVAERGAFTRARKIWLNGVPGYPGPAPNERLGVVDTLIFADQTVGEESAGIPAGAQLLIDFLEDREIRVECLSEEGGTYHSKFKRQDLEFARMVTFNTFLPARLNLGANSPSGENRKPIRVGSKILLNRSPGIVVGSGTRSRQDRHSLSLSADMFGMDPACIGREGELTVSVAISVPVTGSGLKHDICASLASVPGSQLLELISQQDRETASYLKQLVIEGRFNMTDSSFPIEY